MLILLGRDVRYYLPCLIAHYRGLGVERIVYVDNGSSDGSADYVARQENTIVVACGLNFRDYQRELRFIAAHDYAQGGWRMAIDADELLDYPGAPSLSIPRLVERLEARGHTALVAQMLEMVPDESIRIASGYDFANAIRSFRSYSIDNISVSDYHDPNDPLHFFLERNVISNPEIKILRGGIRRTLFSEDCMLTKHVLFRAGPDVLPLPHPHVSCGLHCTDFTAVLRHYKFAGNYLEREQRRQAEKRLSHGEGDMRLKKLLEKGDMTLTVPGMRRDPTPEDLIDQGFLVVSDAALRMLKG